MPTSAASASAAPTLPPKADRLTGRANETSVYSPTCPLQRGRPCILDFTGIYDLFTADSALIIIDAREDDSDRTAGRGGLTARRGSSFWNAKVSYTPSATAKQVTFSVRMEDTTGRILAKARTETFKIVDPA